MNGGAGVMSRLLFLRQMSSRPGLTPARKHEHGGLAVFEAETRTRVYYPKKKKVNIDGAYQDDFDLLNKTPG